MVHELWMSGVCTVVLAGRRGRGESTVQLLCCDWSVLLYRHSTHTEKSLNSSIHISTCMSTHTPCAGKLKKLGGRTIAAVALVASSSSTVDQCAAACKGTATHFQVCIVLLVHRRLGHVYMHFHVCMCTWVHPYTCACTSIGYVGFAACDEW